MLTRTLLICAGLTAAPAAQAAEPPLAQIAVHGGYRAGGALEDAASGADRDLDDAGGFALALELRFRPGDGRYYQLWYSRQGSSVDEGGASRDVDVEHWQLGGTVPIGDGARAQPYMSAGLGLTRFLASGPNARDRARFSGSLGIGVALPLGAHASLRLEARGYLAAMDSDRSIFCRADDGSALCRIKASGSTLFQAEALAGIALRF